MDKEELVKLAQSTGFPRISIYLPTHKTYPGTEQDPIRLSNLLSEAERQLAQAGVRRAGDLVSSARQRINDPIYWRYQDRGLAVFGEAGKTAWIKLPAEVAELAVVGERYHVLPLISVFADRGRFHLLAVTRDSIRFFDGAERELEEVAVENLPSALSERKSLTEFQADLGFHARDRGRQVGGAASPQYHALGESPEDYEEIELERFVREIAKAIDSHLAERAAPLVLAARPRILGRLRQELRYRHIAPADMQHDPASITDDELHTRAWTIAEPLLRRDRDNVRTRLAARLDGAQIPGSENLPALTRAADEGRVESLLVAPDATVWGRYREETREVVVTNRREVGDEDLLNLLAVKVLAQGGQVIRLPTDLAAKAGPVAGLYRY
jgi:hypothetical protein